MVTLPVNAEPRRRVIFIEFLKVDKQSNHDNHAIHGTYCNTWYILQFVVVLAHDMSALLISYFTKTNLYQNCELKICPVLIQWEFMSAVPFSSSLRIPGWGKCSWRNGPNRENAVWLHSPKV